MRLNLGDQRDEIEKETFKGVKLRIRSILRRK